MHPPPPPLILKRNLLMFPQNHVLWNISLINAVLGELISLAILVAAMCLESFVKEKCSFILLFLQRGFPWSECPWQVWKDISWVLLVRAHPICHCGRFNMRNFCVSTVQNSATQMCSLYLALGSLLICCFKTLSPPFG